MKKLTYKSSGVDVLKAESFVKSIQGLVKRTTTDAVLKRPGAFGSLFALDQQNYKKPVIVSSTDGVGTKLLIAKLINKHDTVGIDLVAMNVNDVLCCGAKPLFFLDYIACGRVKPKVLKEIVKGIAQGCRLAGCSLIGGETAEMPGLYKKDDYDLAGFAVGIVEQEGIIDGSRIRAGDEIIGLASNGLHSNGFSLVRKVFSQSELKKHGRDLLKPTRIYVEPVLKVLARFEICGIAHITGGAFFEKMTKILPRGLCFSIDKKSWPVPQIFQMIQKKGKIAHREMFTTFNMGIGMTLVVKRIDTPAVLRFIRNRGLEAWHIGEVIKDGQRRMIL